MVKPTSIRLSEPAARKLAALADLYGAQTKAIEIAIDRLYISEVPHMNAREFVHHSQEIVGGPATEEEIAAARAVGAVNAYLRGVYDVVDERQADAPDGWRVSAGSYSTHENHLPAPDTPAAENEPILMGFVRVHHGDPRWPIWLWKRRATE